VYFWSNKYSHVIWMDLYALVSIYVWILHISKTQVMFISLNPCLFVNSQYCVCACVCVSVWLMMCLCQGLCLCLDSYGACRTKWALQGQLRSPARDHRLACSLPTLPFSPAQSCDYCKRGGVEMSKGGCAGKHRQLFKAWEESPDCSGLTNTLYVGQWSSQHTYTHNHWHTCSWD